MWPFQSKPEIKVNGLFVMVTTKLKRKDYEINLRVSQNVLTKEESVNAWVENGLAGDLIASKVAKDFWAAEIEVLRQQVLEAQIDTREVVIKEINARCGVHLRAYPLDQVGNEGVLMNYLFGEGYLIACNRVVSLLRDSTTITSILSILRNREDLPKDGTSKIQQLLWKWKNQGYERGCADCLYMLEQLEGTES